jgi:uncharacterized protein (TIGR03437 family)
LNCSDGGKDRAVKVNERPAPLLFVSPSQINYQIPPGIVAGPATITVVNSNGVVSTSGISISSVAPGLFAANAK